MKHVKKIISILVPLVLVFTLAVTVSANESQVNVTLRIEGAEKTLFYDTLEIPQQVNLTVWDVIAYADAQDDALVVDAPASTYGIYINSVNGETSGQVAPLFYDGWSYKVNGEDGAVGVDACAVSNGDSIVVYYSDAWGNEGFQAVDEGYDKDIDKGVLKFNSTVVDWSTGEDVPVTTPIVGATVTWGYGDGKTAVYTSDENGEVKIDAKHLTVGDHTLQIEKYSTTITTVGGKLPLVLRLPSDTVVTVKANVNENASSKPEKHDPNYENKEELESPKTHDTSMPYIMVLCVVAMCGIMIISQKRIEVK